MALEQLISLNKEDRHQWTDTEIMGIWEELCYDWWEELRTYLRDILVAMEDQNPGMDELRNYCENTGGDARLRLPESFQLDAPAGVFNQRIRPRKEAEARRTLFDLARKHRSGPAPRDGPKEGARAGDGSIRYPIGKKLTDAVARKGLQETPKDANGKRICIPYNCHSGCFKGASCQDSHQAFEGGREKIRRFKPETRCLMIRYGGSKEFPKVGPDQAWA